MKLNEEERQIMVNLEYERACSCLKQAEGNASMDFWDVVVNRLYYAVFHAVSALLIKDGHNVSTHKGTLVMFGEHYVKTGIFPTDASKLLATLKRFSSKPLTNRMQLCPLLAFECPQDILINRSRPLSSD